MLRQVESRLPLPGAMPEPLQLGDGKIRPVLQLPQLRLRGKVKSGGPRKDCNKTICICWCVQCPPDHPDRHCGNHDSDCHRNCENGS